MFSWGYAGWGNATQELKAAIDRVERSRGFKPPLFVDVRISRSARAEGFKGTTFEKLVGHDRYLWMDDLGNRAVKNKASGIDINNPRAADVLLTLAIENARRPRRVIFFCSCGWPRFPDGDCHRVKVGSLLLKAAERRRRALEVVEWPGGAAKRAEVKLAPDAIPKMRALEAIPLGLEMPSTELLGLPWGSLVTIPNVSGSLLFFAGPAEFAGGRWALRKLKDGLETQTSKDRGLKAGAEWRQRWGFEPRKSRKV